MSHSQIRSYFESTTKTFASSHLPVLRVGYEGINFQKPTTTTGAVPFLITRLEPMSPFDRAVNGRSRADLGVFVIEVWGADGKGPQETETIAAEIQALFTLGLKVNEISVTRTPIIQTAVIKDGWRVVCIDVYYKQEITI